MAKGKRVLRSGKTGLRRSARSKSQPNKKKRKRSTNYDKYERALEEAVVARRVSKRNNKKNGERVTSNSSKNVKNSASSMAANEQTQRRPLRTASRKALESIGKVYRIEDKAEKSFNELHGI